MAKGVDDPFDRAEEVTALLGGGDKAAPDMLTLAKWPFNDLGNARRLMARFGRNLLYVDSAGWHWWDGARWSIEGAAERAALWAQKTAEAMPDEVRALESLLKAEADERDSLWPVDNTAAGMKGCDGEARVDFKRVSRAWGWANGSGDQRRLKAMVEAALPHLLTMPDLMDCDPYLFNTRRATLKLLRVPDDTDDVVQARAQERDDRITHRGDVAFDETADCPRFEAFLKRVLPDDAERAFLQRWFGYCLTGLTNEQVMVVLYGTGANGKSTLVDVIGHVLGDYQMGLPVASLMHDERARGGEASPDIARLSGARLVLASEPDVGNRLSESRVKSMTGGEQMIARHLNRGFFEFYPQFKIVLSCNTRPIIRGADEGIWRRVLLVPFEVQIPPEERDPGLPEALRAEGPGILNWMLDGYRMWVEGGLQVPDKVRAATQDYRADNDPVGEFLAFACEKGPKLSVGAGKLYDAYCAFMKYEMEDKPVNKNLFGRKLTDKGWKSVKRGGFKVYQGQDLSGQFHDIWNKWQVGDQGDGAPPHDEGM